MGWEGVTIMNQRVRFIAEYLNDERGRYSKSK
jgi:hypothetical protein